jgi:UPF0755 protein
LLTLYKSRIKIAISVILLIIAVALSVATISVSYLLRQGPLKEDINIVIAKGTRSFQIAEILAEKEIVHSSHLFWLVSKLLYNKKIYYGEYRFLKHSTLASVLETLINNKIIIRKITFPEGITNFEVMRLITENNILVGDITVQYPEGSLLPETYQYIYGDSKQKILDIMKSKMEQTINILWQTRKADQPLQNKSEALILASIIEKESGLESEKRRIAAVYINRLKRNMPLQADPTVIYSITAGTLFDRKLTKTDLKIVSPHNTYVNKGLPPTPICNPSKTSIEAALNPLETDEIFMVATGSGGHNFSSALVDHNKHVTNYRKLLKGTVKP